MEIQILGGGAEVGRSGILLKDEKSILLDYGIKIEGEGRKAEYPLSAGNVDVYILSHAHLDHSGSSPVLYRYGSPVAFGTEPTLKFSELLIEDSLKINKKNHTKAKFTKKEFGAFSNRFITYPYNVPIEFSRYSISLHDAGHISGSSITRIERLNDGKRVVYTGDFKLSPQLLHGGAEIVETDVLITESTYALREHPDRQNLINMFIDGVKEVVDNNGTALVPVFAVGRAQEVLAILEKASLSDNVYVDGMAKKATGIALDHPEFYKNFNLLLGSIKRVTQIRSKHEREEALNGGKIIVTTAGMLSGGPVLDYITRLNAHSMIFLTGYQAEGTNGRRLLNNEPLVIDGKKRAVRTPFAFYDLSAHAGQEDLYNYVKRSNPHTVVCVHGDEESVISFKDWLDVEGYDAYAPRLGEKIKLKF